jgi:hypothetical protein
MNNTVSMSVEAATLAVRDGQSLPFASSNIILCQKIRRSVLMVYLSISSVIPYFLVGN